MKKILVLCAILFSVIGVQAQKERRVFYYLKDNILYTKTEGFSNEQPFTGSLYTFYRNDNEHLKETEESMKDKKVLVLPDLGQNKKREIKNPTYSFFIQDPKTRYWQLVLFIKVNEYPDMAEIKSLELKEDLIVLNGKTTFPIQR